MIVVIGHKNPDMDSVASAIMEAKRLCLDGTEAEPFISGVPTKDVGEVLKHVGLSLPLQWDNDLASKPTVVVDFNDVEQAPGDLSNVIAIVDHHHNCGDLVHVENKLIKPFGSTATLIARRFLAEHPKDLTRQDAFLLHAAIISDTKNLLSPQTTEEDRQMTDRLAEFSGTTSAEMAMRLQNWGCYQYAPELVPEYLTQSMKCNTINGHLVCSAAIETRALEPFLTQQEQIEAGLRGLDGDVKALIVTA